MKKVLMSLSLVLTLLVAGTAQAAVTVDATHQPTPDMAGWSTWTVTLTTDSGVFTSFAGGFTADAMNQVNPGGSATEFEDANGFFSFVGADVLQDSQFLFHTQNDSLLVVESDESATGLSASFSLANGTNNSNASNVWQLAQVVLPNTGTATFSGGVALRDPANNTSLGQEQLNATFGPVPEPASLALLGLGGLAVLARRRRSC